MAGFKNDSENLSRLRPSTIEGGVDCTYPNCRRGKVTGEEPYVIWDGNLDLESLYLTLPAVAKLAIQENSTDYIQKSGKILWGYVLHPECAAEWGMQLIKDALSIKHSVGRILSGREEAEGALTALAQELNVSIAEINTARFGTHDQKTKLQERIQELSRHRGAKEKPSET